MIPKAQLKVLHIASFIGNIGDNASHLGLENLLRSNFPMNFDVSRLEMRKFYQNYKGKDKAFFDSSFATYANMHDLVIFGGGGFLDYWVKNSQTGTTIDISTDVLNEIKTPIIFGSVGSLPHKDVPEENYNKFRSFLTHILNNDDRHLFLRNDGSKTNLIETYEAELVSEIPEILDHAFFYNPVYSQTTLTNREYVVINTTADQLEMNNTLKGLSSSEFEESIADFINYLFGSTNYDIVLIPHIYKDLYSFFEILKRVDDFHIRTRIKIAPYIQGNSGANQLFNLYRSSIVNIGMRFHSNVCSLAFNKPTIGLSALPRIQNVHNFFKSQSYVQLNNDMTSNLIAFFEKKKAFRLEPELLEMEKSSTLATYKVVLNSIV